MFAASKRLLLAAVAAPALTLGLAATDAHASDGYGCHYKTVTCYERVTKQVEYKYNVMVPRTHQEKKTVSYCDYEVKMVKETVPVCRLVRVQTVDECGRCCYTCQTVTENVEVTRCIRTPINKTREIMVNLVNHDPERPAKISRGDRIAQLIVQRVERADFHRVDELPGSVRGTGGHGSTGGHAGLV